MKRWAVAALILLGLYLACGFYIVRGNEKAVVRRFGRLLKDESGRVKLIASGLYYDLPWPLARIDRVNLNQVRTLSVGDVELESLEDSGFLQSLSAVNDSQFLTGDKNIINVQLNVLYRISEQGAEEFLFRSESPERHLRLLVESSATDLIARSGVDFVHPLGLGELRAMLTAEARQLAAEHQLGLEVDEVTVSGVHPPVRVKAHFLDVSNARADKQNYINAALAYAEQKRATADAEVRQMITAAEIYRQKQVEQSRGAADSFTRVVEQFRAAEREGVQPYVAARHLAVRQRFADAMDDILGNVAGKVFLDSGKPVDLTIFRDPNE